MPPYNTKFQAGTVTESNYVAVSSCVGHLNESGKVFRWSAIFQSVAAEGVVYIHFAPEVSMCGSIAVYSSAGAVKLELFHTPTTTDDGTAVVSYNMNQLSDVLTGEDYVSIFHTPTVTADGTKYGPDTAIFASGGPSSAHSAAPGQVSDTIDTIVDPTKIYLWKVTNIDDNATDIFIHGIYKVTG